MMVFGKILYKSDQGSVYLFDNASSGGVFRYSESYARADDPRAPTNIVGSSGNDSVYIYDRVHRWNSTNREYEYAYSSIEDSVQAGVVTTLYDTMARAQLLLMPVKVMTM